MIVVISDPDFGLIPREHDEAQILDAVQVNLVYGEPTPPWVLFGHFLGRFDAFYTVTDRRTGQAFTLDASFFSTEHKLAIVAAHALIDGQEVMVTGHPTPAFSSSTFFTHVGILSHLSLDPHDYDVWDGRDTSSASLWTSEPVPEPTPAQKGGAARWLEVMSTVYERRDQVRRLGHTPTWTPPEDGITLPTEEFAAVLDGGPVPERVRDVVSRPGGTIRIIRDEDVRPKWPS